MSGEIMETKKTSIVKSVLAVSLAAISSAAGAATSFTWNTADSNYTNTSLGSVTVSSLSAWANTDGSDGTSSALWEQQSGYNNGLQLYSAYDLGVKAKTAASSTNAANEDYSPNHAIDNDGAHEFILFVFNQAVALTEVAIGWPDASSSLDTDMTVVAYTGAADLLATMGTLSSANMTEANGFTDFALSNVGRDQSGSPAWGTPSTFNAGNIESKYWLVGAYNSHLGGSLDSTKDYMKLALVGGKLLDCTDRGNCTPPPGVPEPTTLGLFGLGLVGLRYAKRFRK
ncbi:MAG: PEP-CTERM sorting domain-containing protein [Gammaproteobacteria bacterium]|nr:PEP-CTERM sorting domain-containing protein [Gammaproteobacteria bacterium]